ncbi:MAG: NAD(P)H-dependent oxidoreductase subunit E [Deltaproteobacteria bacterium]|nr:NAD(P)H-dependent oxidoreductase subunit E [Deltaproteobacteria bacterium]
MSFEKVDEILEGYGHRHDALIGMLQDVQRLENYLPLETLQYIGGKLEVPLSRIYYIATFYKSFSLEPVWERRAISIMPCRIWNRFSGHLILERGRPPRTWPFLWRRSTVWAPVRWRLSPW